MSSMMSFVVYGKLRGDHVILSILGKAEWLRSALLYPKLATALRGTLVLSGHSFFALVF